MTITAETRLPGGHGACPISAYEPGDWREVPKGCYAIPVYDWMKFGDDCVPGGPDPVLELLGYVLFQRKAPRVFKTGKTAGREAFIIGQKVLAEGATEYVIGDLRYTPWERLTQEVQSDRFVAEHDHRPDNSPLPPCRCAECLRDGRSSWVRVPGWQEAYANSAAAAILADITDGDTYRPLYGRLTGNCAICGKLLTGAGSKLRGIGPDCWDALHGGRR